MIKVHKIELNDKSDLKKVPNSFVNLMQNHHLGKIAIFFKTERNDVTESKEINKIIEKLENDLKIYLFLTYNLTLESMEVLKKNEINYLSISNFVWTDETYSKRKQI